MVPYSEKHLRDKSFVHQYHHITGTTQKRNGHALTEKSVPEPPANGRKFKSKYYMIHHIM